MTKTTKTYDTLRGSDTNDDLTAEDLGICDRLHRRPRCDLSRGGAAVTAAQWTDGLWTCTTHDDGSATFATELGTEDTEVVFLLAHHARLFVGVQQAGSFRPAAEVVIHTCDVKTILTQIRFLCRAYSIGDYPSEASVRRAIEK